MRTNEEFVEEEYIEQIDENKKIDTYEIHNGVVENVKYKTIESDIEKDVQYCAECLSEMYGIPFEKAKNMVINSHFLELMKEDPIAYGHISFNKWSKQIWVIFNT